MSEVATPTQEEVVSTSTQSDSLVSFLLDEKPVQQQQNQSAEQQQQAAPPAEQKKEGEEVLDPKDWLKREFQVEDPEVLRQQIKEYNELKSKPKEEQSFANEDSKKAYEYLLEGKEDDLYNFLNNKKQVEKLLLLEINDDNAADIIKFAMKQKYKDLNEKEIEYKFNRDFGLPKEPEEDKYDSITAYEEAVEVWKEKVNEIKMERAIEAKLAKPEIEKLKSELKLPDIRSTEGANSQPSQEDLKAMKEAQDVFLTDVQKFTNDFNGFTVQVKDKDVDYSVGYNLDKEEKALLNEKVKTFTEDNFNANAIFAERWLNEDGKSINTEQMIKDLSRVFIGEKFEQKVALDAANKRMEEYLKQKKNINVNETSVNGQTNFSNAQTEGDKLRDAILNFR